ncbi:hypothetical protein T11_16242 [Trichinella zimbabwensis]|uniref:Uncharacterized protein n=1 Tax=Trichinella zimbabwensis TaxID=268475 RepID=A0A0V1I157_9BILA|nr:hypothetical protein T11_16242 [Trichinella zimbabwensis]
MATPELTHSSATGSVVASNVSTNTGFHKISCSTNNRQPSSSGEPCPLACPFCSTGRARENCPFRIIDFFPLAIFQNSILAKHLLIVTKIYHQSTFSCGCCISK